MDHLQFHPGGRNVFATNSADLNLPAQHLDVPYLEEAKYDGEGLEGCLERMGTSEYEVLRSLERTGDSESFIDSCIQQYMYFAVLQEFHSILGLKDVPSFVRQLPDGRKVVTSLPLTESTVPMIWGRVLKPFVPLDLLFKHLAMPRDYETTLIAIKAAANKLEMKKKRAMHSLLKRMNRFHSEMLRYMQLRPLYPGNHLSPRFRILLSIEILLESLVAITATMFLIDFSMGPVTGGSFNIGFTHVLNLYIRQQGWCEWSRASFDPHSLSLKYTLALSPPLDSRDHSDCSHRRCDLSRVSPQKAPSHHKRCSGTCKLHTVDQWELAFIIESGDTPVILSPPSWESSSDITVVGSRLADRQYVAISHVWAHGLGNSQMNALWSCQLRALFKLMQRPEMSKLGLWLDTLCIPVASKYLEQRKKAIYNMRDVYSNTAATFIIDEKMLQVESDSLNRTMYLLSSDWIHRIWTFQEAHLPKIENVYVVMKNSKPIPLAFFEREVTKPTYCRLHQHMALSQTFWEQLHLKPLESNHEDFLTYGIDVSRKLGGPWQLEQLASAFSSRDTYRSADEAICLGILLDLDMRSNGNLPGMEYVYSESVSIPGSLLFTAAPRLKTPRYRALPRTFRGYESSVLRHPSEQNFARLTKFGTEFHGAAFLFRDWKICLHEDNRFSAILECISSDMTLLCVSPDWLDKNRLRGDIMAVIVQRMISEAETSSTARSQSNGFLVTDISNCGEGCFRCRYLHPVTVIYNADPNNQRLELSAQKLPCVAARYAEKAVWTID